MASRQISADHFDDGWPSLLAPHGFHTAHAENIDAILYGRSITAHGIGLPPMTDFDFNTLTAQVTLAVHRRLRLIFLVKLGN